MGRILSEIRACPLRAPAVVAALGAGKDGLRFDDHGVAGTIYGLSARPRDRIKSKLRRIVMLLLLQLLLNGLIVGVVYSLLAFGFALIYVPTRVLHLAYGATYALAALAFVVLSEVVSFPVAAIVAVIAATLCGLAAEFLVYRPLVARRASALVTFLSATGLYIALVSLLSLSFGVGTRTATLEVTPAHRLGPVLVTDHQLTKVGVGMLVLALVYAVGTRTRAGKLVRAFRDNGQLVEAMGVDTSRLRAALFAFGSALGAMAAVLSALDANVDPNIGLGAVLIAATSVIAGGADSLSRNTFTALLLGLLQAVAAFILPTRWSESIVFAVLTAVLLFRPAGVFGTRRRWEEVRG